MFHKLITTIARIYTHRRGRNYVDNIHRYQKNMLQYIVQKASSTDFGRYYNLNTHMSYKTYAKKIPIQTYDTLKPRIEKAKTESNVIWPGKIDKFSASSGTTSAKKHIPVSQDALDSTYKAGRDMLAMYISVYHDTQILDIYSWPLGGTIQETLENGTTIGDVSAHIIINVPRIAKKYAFEDNDLLIADWLQKRKTFAKKLDPQKKTLILGVTSRIYEMLHYLEQNYPRKRKKFIPNIEGIVRGGVSAKPFIKAFQKRGTFRHIGLYNASEGQCGYQDIKNFDNTNADAPYLFFTDHGIFYEFVAINDSNFDSAGNIKPDAKAIPLRKIKKKHVDTKQKFALVMTTNAGLYRYLIGDVIRFIDTKGHFVIEGRTKQSLNLKGEELMVDHTESAIAKLHRDMPDVHIGNYTIGPDSDDNPQTHERIIELVQDTKNKMKIIETIDQYIQEYNADYKAKRAHDILLKIPKVTRVPAGTFHKRLKKNNKLGAQNKIPKLTSDRKLINELKKIASSQ